MSEVVQLLISLGINDQESRKNISKYVESLKTQDLDVTLNINSSNTNDKIFKQMKQQIESLKKQVDDLNKQLTNSNTNSPFEYIFDDFNSDIKKSSTELNKFLKYLKNQDYDYQVKFDVDDESIRKVQQIVATTTDSLGQLRTLKFNPQFNSDGVLTGFKEVNDTFKNTDISQYNKFLKDVDNTLKTVTKSGLLSANTLSDINLEIAKIRNNEDLTLDDKIHKLNVELINLNNQVDKIKLEDEMDKAAKRVANLESSYVRLINSHKKVAQSTDLSDFTNQLEQISKVPVFTDVNEVRMFNKEIDKVDTSLKRMQADFATSTRNNLTLWESFTTAMQKFPVWMASSTIFFGVTRLVTDLYEKAVELNTTLTEMKRVMDQPSYKFNEMLEQSIVNVDELSGRLDDYLKLVTEFGRMGYNSVESLDMASTAQVLNNISDLEATESVDTLVASMISFNVAAEDSIAIADKLNEVDNNFSITTKDLALSLNKSSSTAAAFGATLDDLIGYTTAIGSVTRESGK